MKYMLLIYAAETGWGDTPLAAYLEMLAPRLAAMRNLKKPSVVMDLKTMAISRLMLDNIPHMKAYWIMLGIGTAQVALSYGADDIDGTVVHEKIYHDAGSDTPQELTRYMRTYDVGPGWRFFTASAADVALLQRKLGQREHRLGAVDDHLVRPAERLEHAGDRSPRHARHHPGGDAEPRADLVLRDALGVERERMLRYADHFRRVAEEAEALQDAGIPIVFHVGGTGDLVEKDYFNNGLPIPPDFHGGEDRKSVV